MSNCHFCHLIALRSDTVGNNIHRSCKPCNATYIYQVTPLETVLMSIDLWTTINDKQFFARLKPTVFFTEIYCLEINQYGSKHYKLIKTIDKLLACTPANVKDKIKTILMFQ